MKPQYSGMIKKFARKIMNWPIVGDGGGLGDRGTWRLGDWVTGRRGD
jgi:hypothetical protein